MKFGWLTSRQTKYGAYSSTYILVVLAILVAVNYLGARYNKTYDATKSKLYSLSDQTMKVLGGLDQEVKIYYFQERPRFAEVRDALTRYENASHRVSVSYIDPDSNPALTTAMNIRTLGTVVVEVGGKREEVKSSNEQDITNAIIRAIKGEDRTACLLTGHGEAEEGNSERGGFSQAQTEIEAANYKVQTVSLLERPEIPSECTLLIVAGPDADYLEPEVNILRQYVEGGGRLLLMVDYQKSPKLVELAASWGVNAGNNIVIDLSGIGQLFGGSPLTPVIAQYEAHPITEVMGNVVSLFPMTRSVDPGEAPSGWQVSKLFSTTANSFATEDLQVVDGELRRDASKETKGPISVGAAATYKVPDKTAAAGGESESAAEVKAENATPKESEAKEARLVVTGTSQFARNAFIGLGGNSDLLLNMLNWLSSDEDLISIRPKDPENTPISITQSGMTRLFFGTVIGLPLMIVFAGVRVWWLRR
jgi:gliding motility-associatede transport system auxiliary component